MFGKSFGIPMRGYDGKKVSVGVASSFDGIHNWTNWTSVASMGLTGTHGADTSNNALWDEHLQEYLAFSRIDSDVDDQKYGTRRESRSSSKSWDGPWSPAVQVLRGEHGYEAYALIP